MPKITIKGADELTTRLRKNVNLDDAKRVVRHNGAQLQQKMQQNADFTRGYATGTTKRSIYLLNRDSGLTAVVEPATEYSPYLEYGTRFMSAQPFVKPAFNEQKAKFKQDMDKLTR